MIGDGICFWKFTESINTMQSYFDTSCDNRWIVWDDEPVPNLICPYCNKTIRFTENIEKATDRFPDGSTDWHNWMKYTAGIDPNDEEKIRLVWKVLGRCFEDCENAYSRLRKQEEITQGAKNTEQANQPDSGE